MTDFALHLAPNAPWPWIALASLALIALGVWAYRFAFPPLPLLVRRLLTALRATALLALAWLLAQPVLERVLPRSDSRVVILVDRSASMGIADSRGGPTRAESASGAARTLAAALRGRVTPDVRSFAATLGPDSAARPPADATALGDALASLGDAPVERRPDGVVVISDGVVNRGVDPVAAATALGVPVHVLLVGRQALADRAIAEVEASASARVGERTPVRVHVRTDEDRGTPIVVRLIEAGRELARTTVLAPGSGAEAIADFQVAPTRPGLAVWTARLDSLATDAARENDAKQVAIEVTPGRLGVLVLSSGLQWDLTFFRRALLGDSSVSLDTRVREPGGWRALERGRLEPPRPADLRGRSVVVLDAVAPVELDPEMESALVAFARGGGGLLLFGGPPPGLLRYGSGRFARDLALAQETGLPRRAASPAPTPAAAELFAWDDDPARGERAWREAAPLSDVLGIRGGAGDRVLIATAGGGPPMLFSRRVGRGPVLLVNGTGVWRWSLAGGDALAGERGRRLWRRIVHWLSEPVQGEPLRVQPERSMSAAGEPIQLIATLQDDAFRPVAGARLSGEATDERGRSRPIALDPRASGSYTTTLDGLGPGRWQVRVRATKGGRELGRAATEFAVDRWSLEGLGSRPDRATMAAIAAASGGRLAPASDVARWAQSLDTRHLVRRRTSSTRLWESPWIFAVVVAMLGIEWAWRRRRGLP